MGNEPASVRPTSIAPTDSSGGAQKLSAVAVDVATLPGKANDSAARQGSGEQDRRIEVLTEELRRLKFSDTQRWARLSTGGGTLIATAIGFSVLTGDLVINSRAWPQIIGALGICILWVTLCLGFFWTLNRNFRS